MTSRQLAPSREGWKRMRAHCKSLKLILKNKRGTIVELSLALVDLFFLAYNFDQMVLVSFLPFSGYGNLAPVTAGGRMFCIIYALIGIPLTLMLLAVVGNHIVHYLNEACAWLVNRIRKYHADYEFESADARINAPVWVALPIIFLFLAIMSSMYCALEGWDFGTALYFIFITFTTIGFGDIVPKSAAVSLFSFSSLKYFTQCFVYYWKSNDYQFRT